MRNALLVTIAVSALVAGCRQSADSPSNGSDVANAAAADANGASPMDPLPKDQALKVMHERHEGMEDIGKATKAATRTLKSGAPDLAVIRTSAAAIADLAGKSSGWFPAGTGPDVGKTGAKPEIWQKPEDFAAKRSDFQRSAEAFDAAAKSGDMAAINARFADLGKSCKGCHEGYRKEMKH